MRPNKLAEWALRVNNLRVYYDVNLTDRIVKVIAVGEKVGNDVYIRGKKYEL
jgi:mRNA-degrading endonuclease RelE of RelBE toxin-antitoxin system